jgi:hypothetical protein
MSTTESILAALMACVLSAGLAACGGAMSANGDGESVPAYLTATRDRDDDQDRNSDDAKILDFGHAADMADRRASVALVERYFAAAVAADGSAGCALLTTYEAETLVEESGQEGQGGTCAKALSQVFRLHHGELQDKRATMRVDAVRVQGERGLLILAFPSIPEVRVMVEHRVGSRWRLMQGLDGLLE